MRKALFTLAAVALVVSGCGQGSENDAAKAAGSQSDQPVTTTTTMATTTTEAPTTTTTVDYAPPTLTVTCPEGRAAYVGKPEKWGFGYQFQWWAPAATLWISYGDGRSYTAKTEAQMKAATWHVYDRPGSYAVNATLTDSIGQSTKSACQWTWTDTLAPAIDAINDALTGGGGGGSIGGSSSLAGCYYKGQKLWGSVEVVEYGADITVEVVNYGADLKVEKVDYGATSCGLWEFVDYGADFTVEFVDYGADIEVEFVDYGAGL
jgi:hypothetical protein